MKKLIFLVIFMGELLAKASFIPLPSDTFLDFGESLPNSVANEIKNNFEKNEISLIKDSNLTYNKVVLSLVFGLNSTLQGQDFTDNLTTILNQNLINSNKFIVKNSLNKSSFANSNLTYFLEKDDLDYLVSFELKNYENFEILNKITSQKERNFKGEINYKILSKDKIIFTDFLEFDIKAKSQKFALQNLSKQMSFKIINAIFPLKILAQNGDEFLISSALQEEKDLEIFEIGEEKFQGENSIGFVKNKVAKAKFIKNIGNFALIKIEEGEAKVGDLVEISQNFGKSSFVKKIPNGGVVLPFD